LANVLPSLSRTLSHSLTLASQTCSS
jgi:hypothetical protein